MIVKIANKSHEIQEKTYHFVVKISPAYRHEILEKKNGIKLIRTFNSQILKRYSILRILLQRTESYKIFKGILSDK